MHSLSFPFSLLLILLAAHSAHANVPATCLYTPTKCQCALHDSGRICLRYHSGSPGSEQCESYLCGAGYRCDCSGDHVCELTACSASSGQASVFAMRPTTVVPTEVGQVMPCERVEKVVCAVPSTASPSPSSISSAASVAPSASAPAAPAASGSAEPSASLSPLPSLTSEPSTVPSASSIPSATPSVSMSASPSTSMSGAPSATPSNTPMAVLPLGAACAPPAVAGTSCTDGLQCDCAGVCARTMEMEIRALGDDQVFPLVCGTALGPASPNHYTPSTWTYNGPCVPHIIFETENWGGWENAMGAGLKMTIAGVGDTDWVPTKIGMGGMVAQNPTDMSFLTDGRFDFAASPEWKPVVKQTNLLRFWQITDFLSSIGGADLWALKDTNDLPKVVFYYMMPNPSCPKLW